MMIMCKTAYAIYLRCDFPVEYGYALFLYAMSHLALFSNFYYQTYLSKAKAKHKKEEAVNGTDNNNDEPRSYELRSKQSQSRLIKQRRFD